MNIFSLPSNISAERYLLKYFYKCSFCSNDLETFGSKYELQWIPTLGSPEKQMQVCQESSGIEESDSGNKYEWVSR